jgi:hypothetical protein
VLENISATDSMSNNALSFAIEEKKGIISSKKAHIRSLGLKIEKKSAQL